MCHVPLNSWTLQNFCCQIPVSLGAKVSNPSVTSWGRSFSPEQLAFCFLAHFHLFQLLVFFSLSEPGPIPLPQSLSHVLPLSHPPLPTPLLSFSHLNLFSFSFWYSPFMILSSSVLHVLFIFLFFQNKMQKGGSRDGMACLWSSVPFTWTKIIAASKIAQYLPNVCKRLGNRTKSTSRLSLGFNMILHSRRDGAFNW